MSEREIFHDSQADREGESDGEEIVFREDTLRVEHSTPPTHNMVSANDLDVVIEGWERKFQHLSESIREIQLASEKANINAQQRRSAQHRSSQHRSAQHRSAQHRSAQPRSPRR